MVIQIDFVLIYVVLEQSVNQQHVLSLFFTQLLTLCLLLFKPVDLRSVGCFLNFIKEDTLVVKLTNLEVADRLVNPK